MTIGTGIAIAGVWLLPVACSFARMVTAEGWWGSIVIAGVTTFFLAHYAG